MDFKEATDHLKVLGATQEDIGDALGVSAATVRAARLDPDSASYRSPPDDWRPRLVTFARKRGGELDRFADRLEG